MANTKKSTKLYCFSPPVMIATFLFEIAAMVYVLVRYKMNTTSRLVSALLLNLGLFQLAEFAVCTNNSLALLASRLGYVAITLLPPLGLHLVCTISMIKNKIWLYFSYLAAFLLSGYFLLAPNAFKSNECTGNYVIFQIGELQAVIYSFYYFGLIAATMMLALKYRKNSKGRTRKALTWTLLAYLVFIIPVAIIIITHPDTREALPSILCGFAVFFAIILTFKISPIILKRKNYKQLSK